MKTHTTRIFWIQVSLASLTGILLTITLITREWIELLFGIVPDGGNGAIEWSLVAALAVATVVFTVNARSEWVRVRSSSQ